MANSPQKVEALADAIMEKAAMHHVYVTYVFCRKPYTRAALAHFDTSHTHARRLRILSQAIHMPYAKHQLVCACWAYNIHLIVNKMHKYC